MVEKTNNKKAIDKDYLAEQFYNYNKKFIINDIKANKQDNLTVISSHIKFTNPELDLNIVNDKDAKQNDYLVLNSEDGDLKWKTPIKSQSDLKDNDSFIPGKILYDFKGSENIETVGEIKSGTWNIGSIKINNDSLEIGSYELKDNTENLEISNKENKGIVTNSVITYNIEVRSKEEDENGETGSINTEKLSASEAIILTNTVDNLKVNNIEAATENNSINVKSEIVFEKALKALIFKTDMDRIITINNKSYTVTRMAEDNSADFIDFNNWF
jgi:hypothetical protein